MKNHRVKHHHEKLPRHGIACTNPRQWETKTLQRDVQTEITTGLGWRHHKRKVITHRVLERSDETTLLTSSLHKQTQRKRWLHRFRQRRRRLETLQHESLRHRGAQRHPAHQGRVKRQEDVYLEEEDPAVSKEIIVKTLEERHRLLLQRHLRMIILPSLIFPSFFVIKTMPLNKCFLSNKQLH